MATRIRLAAVLAAALVTTVAGTGAAGAPSVAEHFGNIVYTDAHGAIRQLGQGGGFGDPVLSPDGRTVAFIRIDGPSPGAGDWPPTSLWIADGVTGTARVLFASRSARDPSANMSSFEAPIFSLDGGFLYVSAQAGAVSPAVHQIAIATGAARYVIDGAIISVIRSGPYRGYLLVGRHMYYAAPKVGSYDCVYVVRPDAKVAFMVPGTDADDTRDHVAPWLRLHGWRAW